MKIINLSEQNTILNRFVSEMRDINVQTDSLRFRKNVERIGEIMAYEISKSFDYAPKEVETPLGHSVENIHTDKLVIGTILRAGLVFHHGFLNFFDDAENAFVSAYRKMKENSKSFSVHIEYIASPKIDGKVLILTDPMLATGSSMDFAYQALRTRGDVKHLHIATIVASNPAIEYCKANFPADKTTIWAAAIDPELNDHAYIVPGLGDVGDLAYGEKE